ncbi:MAG: hypothetical protein HYZ53_23615 [Planctomycetes bacterium]|nr:hypothetical protein [Planctomycetota bacterium]
MANANAVADSAPTGGVPDNVFTLTFNIETLRMVAYIVFLLMLGVGKVVTTLFVKKHLEDTVIFHIFGFNHICNVFDHQPSRTISALLVLFFILPMAGFVVSSYYRTYDAAKEGRVPMRLQTYNKCITPFVLLSVCYTYMWFVNPPDGDYGFIAHYLPYVALQLALGLLAIQEVGFLVCSGVLPFGVSVGVAKGYLALLLSTTLACQVAVFTLLLGFPILDSPNDPTACMVFQVLIYFYAFLAVVMPIFLAAANRKNGRVNTISFG